MATRENAPRRGRSRPEVRKTGVSRIKFIHGFWDAVRDSRAGVAGNRPGRKPASITKKAYATGYGAGRVAVEETGQQELPLRSCKAAWKYAAAADP